MKIAIEKLEINATNEEVNVMSAWRDNENWMLCFLTALMAMNDRSKEATLTLQPEKNSDNMQMSVEELNKQYEEALHAAGLSHPLYENGKKALTENVVRSLAAVGYNNITNEQAYKVIDTLNHFGLINGDAALKHILEG